MENLNEYSPIKIDGNVCYIDPKNGNIYKNTYQTVNYHSFDPILEVDEEGTSLGTSTPAMFSPERSERSSERSNQISEQKYLNLGLRYSSKDPCERRSVKSDECSSMQVAIHEIEEMLEDSNQTSEKEDYDTLKTKLNGIVQMLRRNSLKENGQNEKVKKLEKLTKIKNNTDDNENSEKDLDQSSRRRSLSLNPLIEFNKPLNNVFIKLNNECDNELNLKCSLSTSVPTAIVQWSFNGNTKLPLQYPRTSFDSKTACLKSNNIRPEHSGFYACQITNPVDCCTAITQCHVSIEWDENNHNYLTNKIPRNSDLTLNSSASSFNNFGFEVDLPPGIEAYEGSNIVIECRVARNIRLPVSSIPIWIHDGVPLVRSGSFDGRIARLAFIRCRLSDSGSYHVEFPTSDTRGPPGLMSSTCILKVKEVQSSRNMRRNTSIQKVNSLTSSFESERSQSKLSRASTYYENKKTQIPNRARSRDGPKSSQANQAIQCDPNSLRSTSVTSFYEDYDNPQLVSACTSPIRIEQNTFPSREKSTKQTPSTLVTPLYLNLSNDLEINSNIDPNPKEQQDQSMKYVQGNDQNNEMCATPREHDNSFTLTRMPLSWMSNELPSQTWYRRRSSSPKAKPPNPAVVGSPSKVANDSAQLCQILEKMRQKNMADIKKQTPEAFQKARAAAMAVISNRIGVNQQETEPVSKGKRPQLSTKVSRSKTISESSPKVAQKGSDTGEGSFEMNNPQNDREFNEESIRTEREEEFSSIPDKNYDERAFENSYQEPDNYNPDTLMRNMTSPNVITTCPSFGSLRELFERKMRDAVKPTVKDNTVKRRASVHVPLPKQNLEMDKESIFQETPTNTTLNEDSSSIHQLTPVNESANYCQAPCQLHLSKIQHQNTHNTSNSSVSSSHHNSSQGSLYQQTSLPHTQPNYHHHSHHNPDTCPYRSHHRDVPQSKWKINQSPSTDSSRSGNEQQVEKQQPVNRIQNQQQNYPISHRWSLQTNHISCNSPCLRSSGQKNSPTHNLSESPPRTSSMNMFHTLPSRQNFTTDEGNQQNTMPNHGSMTMKIRPKQSNLHNQQNPSPQSMNHQQQQQMSSTKPQPFNSPTLTRQPQKVSQSPSNSGANEISRKHHSVLLTYPGEESIINFDEDYNEVAYKKPGINPNNTNSNANSQNMLYYKQRNAYHKPSVPQTPINNRTGQTAGIQSTHPTSLYQTNAAQAPNQQKFNQPKKYIPPPPPLPPQNNEQVRTNNSHHQNHKISSNFSQNQEKSNPYQYPPASPKHPPPIISRNKN